MNDTAARPTPRERPREMEQEARCIARDAIAIYRYFCIETTLMIDFGIQ